MQRTNIKSIFNKELTDFLEPISFKYEKIADAECYIHRLNDMEFNEISYHIQIVGHLAPVISKRFSEIEEILGTFLDKYGRGYGEEASTISCSITFLTKDNRNYSREITSEAVAYKVLEEFKKDILHYVFPFFEQYASLPALDWLFNNYKEVFNTFIFDDKYDFRRVITAKLCNNPNYEAIAEEARIESNNAVKANANMYSYYPSLWQDLYNHLKTVEPKYTYLQKL